MTATALDEAAHPAEESSPATVDPARLEALRRYEVRDDLVHPDLDGVARLAAFVAGTSSAALFLPERDGRSVPGRVVATHGCDRSGLSRGAVEQHQSSASADLMTADGVLVGALVVFDQQAVEITPERQERLGDLADQAMALLELRRMALRLARMSTRDPLTGLANRRSLEQAVAASIARAERGLGTPSVVAIDLNGFDQVNEAMGRETGDALLREVADRLTRTARGVDTVSRLVNDDFAVLLEHTGGTGATAALGRLRACVADLTAGGGEVAVSVALGVATYRPGDSVASLMSRADAEMYAEKTRA
jgi:diguanylate cyclase (GGDEF)-like protein